MVLALSPFVFSNAQAAPLRSGAYVGAGISSTWLHLKSSRTVTFHNLPPVALPTISFSRYSQTALGAQIKAGYQKIFNNHFFLGTEFTFDTVSPSVSAISTVNWPDVPATFQAQAQLKHSYALSLLLGHTLNASTAVYARLGVAYAPSYYNFVKMGTLYIQEQPRNKGLWGPRLGVGIVHQLSKHLLMSLDYAYTFYQAGHYSEVIGSNPMNPSQYTASNKSYHLHTQQAVLSLSYLF